MIGKWYHVIIGRSSPLIEDLCGRPRTSNFTICWFVQLWILDENRWTHMGKKSLPLRVCLAPAFSISFYVQFSKILLFPLFFHFFKIFLGYKYTLAHFRQNIFSKKLDNLFLKRRSLAQIKCSIVWVFRIIHFS